MLLLINHDMKVINDKEFFCCCMKTPLEFSNLITKIIRDYEQKLLTQHQIMALCPFHMSGISEGLPGGVLVPFHFFPMFPCSRSFSLFVPYNILVYHIPTTLNFPTPLKN